MGQSNCSQWNQDRNSFAEWNPVHIRMFYYNNEERIKLLSQESKVSKFCVDAGFVHFVEVTQYFMTKDTDDFLKNFMQLLVVNTLFQEMMNHHNQEDGFTETWELDLYWKSRPVTCTKNMELKLEFGLWVKTILILGSEYNNTKVPADLSEEQASQAEWESCYSQIRGKSKITKERNCCNEHYSNEWKKSGLILIQQNPLSLRTRSRRKSSIFFDTVKRYNEKMTEQFNSEESRFIFEINFHKNQYCSDESLEKMLDSRRRFKKEDISTALIFQE